MARPTRSPRTRLILVLGAEGEVGAIAGVIIDRLTGEVPPVFGFSRVSTALIKLSATAWAVAAAWTALPSWTEIVISTVFASVVAFTRVASSCGLTANPSESMAG